MGYEREPDEANAASAPAGVGVTETRS